MTVTASEGGVIDMRMNGNTLRSLREAAGWSQRELGDLMGRAAGQVSRWEVGKSRLSRGADAHARLLFATKGMELLVILLPYLVDLIDRLDAAAPTSAPPEGTLPEIGVW